MKKLLLTPLFLLIACVCFAQTVAIEGTVQNQNKEILAFAGISLHTFADSLLVKSEIADEKGIFKFTDIASGQYFIRVSSVGFINFRSEKFEVGKENLRLEPYTLLPSAQTLNEVKVTATKPLIEVQNDKIVFNVENSINSTGSTGLELLRKVPGVQIDKDENILVKGKQGVRIYIDGRPSQMTGQDLASILKSMNSADIEAIEVITNPSAKYDAAGDLGIINIRLKKNKNLGTNGSITANANFGITPKYNGSLTLNHRDKKVNIFGTYGYNQGAWHNTTNDDQILNNISYKKLWNGIWRDTTHNMRLGTDYFLSSKSTIGVNVNGRMSDQNGGGQSRTSISKYRNFEADSVILDSKTSNPTKSQNWNFNLNYRYADTTGHELNVDADYGIFRSRRKSFQPNTYHFLGGESDDIERNYITNTPVDIIIKSFKADYEQPFKKGKLGYGFKLADVTSDNTFDFYTVENEQPELDIDRSNRFRYTERVYAGYINYNKSFAKKWSIQAGLRLENTKSIGDLKSYKENALNKVDTTYLNLFPSGSLSYKANDKHNFSLNYSRRINRPTYQNLNPFEYRIDELVYSKGNPFLKPEYANTFKLTHVFKGQLTTSIGYMRTKFPVATIRIPYDESRTYFFTDNLDHSTGYNLDISYSASVTKWWTTTVNVSGYHSIWQAKLDNGLIINNPTTAFNFNSQNTFKVGKTWTFELSGWYNSPYRRIDYNYAMGMMDAGVQKKFWKDNATLKLSMSDLLRTAHGGYHSEYAGIATDLRFKFEGRMVKLNFTYRFGSNDIKAARSRRSGNEDEQNRIR